MTFTIINTNCNNGCEYWFRVHKAGCQDINLEKRKYHADSYEESGEDVESMIKEMVVEFKSQEQEFPRETWSTAPCTKNEK